MVDHADADGTELLADISGGRVLDAATGSGSFIVYLQARLRDYVEFVGIDLDATVAEPFGQRFADDPRVQFRWMDARRLEFPPGSFDTASIAHALCEYADPLDVLAGLVRTVRKRGHLIVAETFREQESEPTLNHVRLHDWWAAVEALAGADHHPYRPMKQLVGDLERLALSELRVLQVPTDQTDPKDSEMLAQLDDLAEMYLARAAGHQSLRERGLALMKQVHEVGHLPATALLAVGRV